MSRPTPLHRSLLASFLLAAGSLAGAATTPAVNFNVTATVQAACSVGAIADLAFGNYNPTLGNGTNSTTANVTCSLGTAYSMNIGQGQNASTDAGRRMKDSGTNYLNYNVYTDVARSTIWPSTGTATGTTGTGTGLAIPVTIYGNLPAGQAGTAPPGSYSDVLAFTVTY